MLKLAAMGVISVPQKPDEHPDRADDRRVAAVRRMRIGTPIAAAITGNAANALPMIIVNTTMPSA